MSLGKITSIFVMFLISMVLLSAIVFSADIPVTIDDVKVNGDSLSPSEDNRVKVERGDELEIKVILTGTADTGNVQVEARISGYEYDYRESVSDVSHAFDVYANVTYRKKLYIKLPENVDEDSYKLRIIVANRDDNEITQNYNLKIDAPRHSMIIRDIILTPQNEVVAGKSLLAAVRVKNLGDRDEDSVKVSISIPELGLSASDYIDEVEREDSETSEELFLKIPGCAEPGIYNVEVKVEYDEGYEDVSETVSIEVVEGDSCVIYIDDEDEEDEEVEDEDGSDDAVVSDTANMTADDSGEAEDEDDRKDMLRTALEIGLICLIIALVIIGLIIGFMKLSEEKSF